MKIKEVMLKKYVKESICGEEKIKGLLKNKKNGDHQLVISLVLIVIGCVLCFLYRDKVTDLMTSALTTLSGKLTALFNGI